MERRSSFDKIFCSNGSRFARVSSSAFSRSRCLLLGLDLVTPSFGGGFKLQQNNTQNISQFSLLYFPIYVFWHTLTTNEDRNKAPKLIKLIFTRLNSFNSSAAAGLGLGQETAE